jgi:hypothetical protein
MAALGNPLCPICRQHVILKLLELAGGVAGSTSPESTGVPVAVPARFQVKPAIPCTIRWQLDSTAIGAADNTDTFDQNACIVGTLEAKVDHSTPWVLQDPDHQLSSTVRWPMSCPSGATRTYQGDQLGPIPDGSFTGLKSALVIEPGTMGRMRVNVRGHHEQPLQIAGELRGPGGLRLPLIFETPTTQFAVSMLVPALELGGTWTAVIVDPFTGATGALDGFDAVVELTTSHALEDPGPGAAASRHPL